MVWFLVLLAIGVVIAVLVRISAVRRPGAWIDRPPPAPGPAPAGDAARPGPRARPADLGRPNPEGRWFGRSAVVVEDSATIQRLVAMVLVPEGLDLLRAGDMQAARRQLAGLHPDLLIADRDVWLAGGGPGQGTVTDPGAAPVILLAGRQAGPPAAEGPGVLAVVGKPFDSAELLEAVERALARIEKRPVCPVCGDPAGDEPIRCPACGRAHHPECWTLNDGCGQCNRSA